MSRGQQGQRPKSRWSIKWSEKHIFKAEQEGPWVVEVLETWSPGSPLKRILIFQTSVLGFLGGGQLMFFVDFHPENWGRFERAYFFKGVGWNHQLGPGFRGESSVVGKVWVNCWEMFYPSNQFMVLFFWGRTCWFFFGWGALFWIVLAKLGVFIL